jgi:hypothetical protein
MIPVVMWLQRGRCYVVCGHIRIPREFVRPGKSYYGKRRTESASRVTLDFALSERLSTCDPNPVPEIRATLARLLAARFDCQRIEQVARRAGAGGA